MPSPLSPTNAPPELIAMQLLGWSQDVAANSPLLWVHDRLMGGLSTATADQLLKQLKTIRGHPRVLSQLGMTRRSAWASKRRLSRSRSEKLWGFARHLAQAIYVLGGQEAGERWLVTPALAFDGRAPIEFLATSVGRQMIQDHLTRMDFGVFA